MGRSPDPTVQLEVVATTPSDRGFAYVAYFNDPGSFAGEHNFNAQKSARGSVPAINDRQARADFFGQLRHER